MSSFKKTVDNSLNAFGNKMGDLRQFGLDLERLPERAIKGAAKGAVKVPGALARGGADVGVGVLKELSSVVAYGAREATGAKKKSKPYKSNVAKGWFE